MLDGDEMKAIFVMPLMALIILYACSSNNRNNQLEKDVMQNISDGAYLLSQVTITEKGETTIKHRDQIKIYTKGKYMFAFDNESTGDIDVGAGNATWVDGIMVEEPLVNHDGDLSGLSFEITIKPTKVGFDQVLHGMKYDDGRILDTMVEVWRRAPGMPSPYDGLWRLESRKGGNTKLTEFSEIKMIGGGYFIILQRANYEGKKVRNFGFGSLNLNKSGVVLETGMVGSWKEYHGMVSEVKYEMIDENRMEQTFISGDIEINKTYVRM